MNILILNDFGHVNGGTSQVAIANALALAAGGHAVTYFCAVGPVAPELAAAGLRVVCLDQQEIAADPDRLRAARQGLWNGVAARALDRLLAEYAAPPIVHIHGWSKALSASVCAAAVARRAPVVVTLHDFFAACPNGGFYQYPQQRICELTAMSAACIACNCDSRSYGQKLYRVARQAAQWGPGRLPGGVRHFIHHSRLARDVLAPYLPADARLHFLPMAIDVPAGPPVAVADNTDFLMAGRLAPEKGVTLFAEAANIADVMPVFAGEGRMRAAILAAAPQAEITGWLPREALAARMGRARALVLASRWYETFGLVVAEALAQGIPVIVPDRNAAAELVEDGVTGLVFRSGDVRDLAAKITRLKDGARAAALGAAAHARYWAAPLTVQRHVDATLAVYRAMEARA